MSTEKKSMNERLAIAHTEVGHKIAKKLVRPARLLYFIISAFADDEVHKELMKLTRFGWLPGPLNAFRLSEATKPLMKAVESHVTKLFPSFTADEKRRVVGFQKSLDTIFGMPEEKRENSSHN